MNFNSLPFLLLALGTLALYYLPPLRRHQVSLLIAASFLFYAYGQPYLLLLLLCSATLSAITSYRVLTALARAAKLRWAIAGVVANLAVLAFFKYNHLLSQAVAGELGAVAGPVQWLLTLPLPIGISFYTFHGISLVVDVFKRGELRSDHAEHERNGWRHYRQTLLYLTFFPQLIAGPIAKAHFFYPQITAKQWRDIDWNTAVRALIAGYFLKCVVADNLQDQTFWIAYPYFLNFSSLNLAAFLFGYSMQIFADFAGYSLIALGLAALFGYRLPQNFNFPYISRSFSEFWTRWHMSLSAFLKEYLYIPLGGNRHGRARTALNLMITMTLGGLWHGAALSYAVWGAWHGAALTIEHQFRNSRFYTSAAPVLQLARLLLVFIFISAAWLLFKLPNFSEAVAYVRAIGTNRHLAVAPLFPAIIALYALPVLAYHAYYLAATRRPGCTRRIAPLAYGLMLTAIALNTGRPSAFIYFQF